MFLGLVKSLALPSLRAPLAAALAALVLVVGCSPTDNQAVANIQAAVDNPARGDDAHARDERRKPVQVLSFFGVAPGMTVLEVGAGGGYYTEILSAAVGPEGEVIAQNTPSDYYLKYVKASFDPLAARLDNVEPRLGPLPELELDDNSVDLAILFLVYHHMHYNEADGDALPGYTGQSLAKLMAALKPGGILAVIEHAAPSGTSRADSAALHRVDEAATVGDITGAGFRLADKSRLLQVETDDRTVYWYKTPHQGKTWRLMHKYVKS